MKTITLTNYEYDVIKNLLWDAPSSMCNSGCVLDYKTIDCDDTDKNGEPRCKLQKALKELHKKFEKE